MINNAFTASRGRRAAASLLCLTFVFYPLLAQQETPLTLDTAVKLALERNEQALATRDTVASAEAAVTRARAFFLPAITTTGTYTRRPFEVRRTVGSTEIVVQQFNALSGVASLNMTLFDSKSIPGLNSANVRPSFSGTRINARFAASVALRMASATSRALPWPKPTRPR